MKSTGNNNSRFADDYTQGWVARCLADQRKRWLPLLSVMTAEELSEFHAYRLGKAGRFFADENTPGGRNERDEAERFLFAHWHARLRKRLPSTSTAGREKNESSGQLGPLEAKSTEGLDPWP